MKKGTLWGIVIAVILIGISVIAGQYNSLVKLEETVKSQRGQVESVYQRRADLIPNIVATVKGAGDVETSSRGESFCDTNENRCK